jgi:hypothetical protein
LKPIAAIHEINQLTKDQMILLSYEYAYGLRGEHLRKYNASSKIQFTSSHSNIISLMIHTEKLTAENAIDRLIKMNEADIENYFTNNRRTGKKTNSLV